MKIVHVQPEVVVPRGDLGSPGELWRQRLFAQITDDLEHRDQTSRGRGAGGAAAAADEAELQKAEFQQGDMQQTEEFYHVVSEGDKWCSYSELLGYLFLTC